MDAIGPALLGQQAEQLDGPFHPVGLSLEDDVELVNDEQHSGQGLTGQSAIGIERAGPDLLEQFGPVGHLRFDVRQDGEPEVLVGLQRQGSDVGQPVLPIVVSREPVELQASFEVQKQQFHLRG